MLRLRKRSVATALIVLLALVVVAACSATGGKRAADAAANAVSGSSGHANTPRYTFDMITHAQPGDTFWDIIRAGASAAAAKDNIAYHYSNNQDPTQQAQLIQDAINSHVNGIAVTDPDPQALCPTILKAKAAGIPVVMFNAGIGNWQSCGAMEYFGSDENVAGTAAGKRLAAAGAKNVLCVLQAQGQVQLEARCAGVKAGLGYGNIIALSDISLEVGAGEVTCVLGDNGAGKSTLIKIIAGLHQPSEGTYEVEGSPVSFDSPREALELGIATVYQDLAVCPLMPVWRNFFLGNEVQKGLRMDIPFMRKTCKEEMLAMGIDLRDVDQPIGTLSGGERQCVAISRAVYYGAKVLILDEPTAALGVKQSGIVLKYIIQARERGLGVIFITHNPHHAYPVGDRFLLLNRGRSIGSYEKSQVTRDELTGLMAGGNELEALSHELESAGGAAADAAAELEEDAEELGTASHEPSTGNPPT